MNTYDVAVVGGGPGGYVAALRAALLGLRTVIVEKGEMGGTCLNRGCIPTKSLLQSAQVYHIVKESSEFGIDAGEASFDFQRIAARKNNIVSRLRGGIEALVRGRRIELVRGEGRVRGAGLITVGEKEIRAANIILATGSVPSMPAIPGSDLPGVMNSDAVLAMESLPKSAVIIGGGVIGMEFAALFSMFGTKVTLVEALPTILTGMDPDISRLMLKLFKKRGVEIHTGVKVRDISPGDGLTVRYAEGGEEKKTTGDIVVMATGRKPSTAGLDALGLKLERGGVVVDDHMRTNIPNVYAIGDCTGRVQLAHVASAQGIVAAHSIAGREMRMHYDVIPACVYTTPEIACVGMTEEAAKASGRAVRIGSFPVMANGKSMIMGESDGFCKLVTDAGNSEILGAHIVAPHATDMIGEIAAVMRAEGTVEELSDTIHPHPTVGEIILEAAHDVEGLCGHKL